MSILNTICIKIISCFSPIIRLWERKYIQKYGCDLIKHQPLFVVAAPRTGSTILSQIITNRLDVLYFSNLSCRLSENLFFSFWLADKLYGGRAHNCFISSYGSTLENGNNSPSECGKFWYRWLPLSPHYIRSKDISCEDKCKIKKEITAITNYYDKPVVFTNNNMGLRIEVIADIFPDAKFVVADRKPVLVAQSLLKARERFHGSNKFWWSIMPPNYSEIVNEPIHRQVVYQHYYINKQIMLDLKSLYEGNFLWVQYGKFCNDQEAILKQIEKLIDYKKYRSGVEVISLRENKEVKLSSCLLSDIESIIEGLDWYDYSS